VNEFYKALEEFLEQTPGKDGKLADAVKGRVLTVLGDDAEAPQAVDDFQKANVMRSKGCGLVVFGAAGVNTTADSPDVKLDAVVNFQVLLLLSPLWGGRAFGERKWKQLEVLTDLLKTLNGAEVGPGQNNCAWSVRVEDWNPELIEGLNAWTVSCRKKLRI